MPSLLTNDQKKAISMLAREAYVAWPGRAAFEECNFELSASKCFEAWRHVEQGKAMGGRQSLRLATQDDFLPLRAHFRAMLGNAAGALRDHLRHAEEPRIRARWKSQQVLDERGLDPGYAAAICRRQFKCELGDASEKQIWKLFFTVTNRRKKIPARPALAAAHAESGNPY